MSIRKIILAILVFLAGGVAAIFYLKYNSAPVVPAPAVSPTPGVFAITSSAFGNNKYIPVEYTCDGPDKTPDIKIFHPPEGTKSFVLRVVDPDSPGGNFVHWLLWNIPVSATGISPTALSPDTVSGKNGFGKSGYGGPCPTGGLHHYIFTLYALDTYLLVPADSDWQAVALSMNTHILAQTSITGLYSRK